MKWLIIRRLSQMIILCLFLLGPLTGIWIITGDLAGSTTLDVLPLTDPLTLLQTLLAGHTLTTTALTGVAIVLCFYLLVGGRVFCSWVCPVNIINDTARWLGRRIPLQSGTTGTTLRYWLLALVCLIPLTTHIAGWEHINPVNIFARSTIFLQTEALWVLGALLLFGLLIKGGWCRICPTGALYSILGHFSPLKVRTRNKETCDHCNACYQVCPEPQVLTAPLKDGEGVSSVITSGQCTNCGRCIDVCHKNIFKFGSRF
jgi:ferredoxin-type protein NapH